MVVLVDPVVPLPGFSLDLSEGLRVILQRCVISVIGALEFHLDIFGLDNVGCNLTLYLRVPAIHTWEGGLGIENVAAGFLRIRSTCDDSGSFELIHCIEVV